MTWVKCPFCNGEGSKGIVPVLCTTDEFIWLEHKAKINGTSIDSVFVHLVREAIKKEFPDWMPYNSENKRTKKLVVKDFRLILEEENQ